MVAQPRKRNAVDHPLEADAQLAKGRAVPFLRGDHKVRKLVCSVRFKCQGVHGKFSPEKTGCRAAREKNSAVPNCRRESAKETTSSD
jgi:hypothetical protein